MSEAAVNDSTPVQNNTVKPQGRAQLLFNLLRRKSSLPATVRTALPQEAFPSLDRKFSSQVLHSVPEEQSIDKSLTVPSFHKSSHQSKLKPPVPLPPPKLETSKETVSHRSEKEKNSTLRSTHSEPFSHGVFSLLEEKSQETKNKPDTLPKTYQRRSSLVAPPRTNSSIDWSDYRKLESPTKPVLPKLIPQKPPRKSLRPSDEDFLLRDVESPFEFVPEGRKSHARQKSYPSFKSPSLHSNSTIPAAQKTTERSPEWFNQVRNEWVKKARAVESMQWIIGNKEAHEKRVERFFITTQAENRFCDVVIQTTDNHTILAHSLVLAAHSKAFQKRLLAMNPGTGVPTTYRLNLTDKVSGTMLAKAVDWMYKGYTRIPAYQLEELARVARYFQIIPLAVECVRIRREMEAEAGDHKLLMEKAEAIGDVGSLSRAPSSLNDVPPTNTFLHKPTRRRDQLPIQHRPEDFPDYIRAAPRSNSKTGPVRLAVSNSTQWSNPPSARSIRVTSAREQLPPSLSKLSSGFSSKPEPVLEKRSPKENSSNKKPDVGLNLANEETRNTAIKPAQPVDVIEEPSIATMTVKQMHDLLGDDNLDVQSELEVLDAAMAWIAVAPAQREIYTHHLLSCVRFCYLSNEELKSCFHSNPDYFKIPAFRNLIGNAFRARALVDSGHPLPDGAPGLPKRRCGSNKNNSAYLTTNILIEGRNCKSMWSVVSNQQG